MTYIAMLWRELMYVLGAFVTVMAVLIGRAPHIAPAILTAALFVLGNDVLREKEWGKDE